MNDHEFVTRRYVPPELRLITLESGRRSMTLTPWGVLVDEPYPWDRIAAIQHWMAQGSDNNRVESFYSFLSIRSGARVLTAQGHQAPVLEALTVLLPHLSAECRRPIALTFNEGGADVAPGAAGAFATLVSAARAFVETDQGHELAITSGGYRDAKRTVRPEAISWLRRMLLEGPSGSERGALGAILAAILHIEAVVDDLCALALSPNPLLAAACKAAALRLNAHPMRPGPLEEMRGFLGDRELEQIWDWAHGSSP